LNQKGENNMSEKLGIVLLTSVVKSVAQCANVFSKLIHKQGLLVLLGLQEPVAVLSSVAWPSVLDEVKDLSTEERVSLEKVLSDTFQPMSPMADVGLDKFLAMGEKTAAAIEKDVAAGKEAYETAKELVSEWKAFLGVA
jgi:hypothetical protein